MIGRCQSALKEIENNSRKIQVRINTRFIAVNICSLQTQRYGSITAAVTVTNTGKRDGAEVVQLYIRDLVGSITRPVKELKGFEKIFLKAGESKTVTFKITPELLRFYDYHLKQVAEPGDFDVMIGGDSRNVRSARLTLK